jgi:hypothetical protein
VTPAFGDAPEVVRISGTTLVREVGSDSTWLPLTGSTLRDLATFVEVDPTAPFDCGTDGPPAGDLDELLAVHPDAVRMIADWFALGWQVLDAVIDLLPPGSTATTTQLWPEHFDAGTTIQMPSTEPVNLGFSPGDGFAPEPYVYVGPWSEDRPGDAAYWNAPFGAVRHRSEVRLGTDPATDCRDFILTGLLHLTGLQLSTSVAAHR